MSQVETTDRYGMTSSHDDTAEGRMVRVYILGAVHVPRIGHRLLAYTLKEGVQLWMCGSVSVI
jgi:hypothetical protein